MNSALAATYNVTSTADSGTNTLRAAIGLANGSGDNDVIEFAAALDGATITLNTQIFIDSAGTAGTLRINDNARDITLSGGGSSGIFDIATGANVNLNHVTITDGSSSFSGGINNNGILTVTNSTLRANTATAGDSGGAIYNSATGILEVINSTLAGNSAPVGSGGGIENDGEVTLVNSTLSGNSVGVRNFSPTATMTIRNTIVANSTSGTDCIRSDGTINAQNSLIESGLACVNGTNTANLAVDPDLAGLTGSPAYFPLNSTSPVIDAGNNTFASGVLFDQAGNPRVQNSTVDMGSFEFAVPEVTIGPATANVTEGNSTTVTLTRTGSAGNLVVELDVFPDADIFPDANTFPTTNPGPSGADYTLSGASITGQENFVQATIPDGQSSVDITFSTVQDDIAEGDNLVEISIDISPSGSYSIGAADVAEVTIPAEDFVVNLTDDRTSPTMDGSLRQAIRNANDFPSDDTITFTTSGVITLTDIGFDIIANGSLTVDGNNDIIVDGDFFYRPFFINAGADVTLRGLTIQNADVGSNTGGGVYNGGTLRIENSSLLDNVADTGGGIYSTGVGSSVTVINSTLGNNRAYIGGGIYNDGDMLTLINVTLNDNTSTSSFPNTGGGLVSDAGSASIQNTIIAASGIGVDCITGGGTITIQHSLIQDGGCGVVAGTDGNLTGNPQLGALQSPGNIPPYYPLTATSPAIDAGDNAFAIAENLETDQIGNPRVQGASVDMGAVETGSTGCPTTRTIPHNRWTQVGIPCDDSTLTVGSVFGGDGLGTFNTDWAVWHFDTSTQQNTQLLNLSDPVQIGKGYWLKQITGGPVTIDADGSAATLPNGYPLTGATGGLLNLIGNYQAAPESICWADVLIDDGTNPWTLAEASTVGPGNCSTTGEPCIYGTAYRWNGNAYDTLTGTTPGLSDGALGVMDSVWVQAYRSGLSLIIPATGPCPVTRTRLAADEWYQRLRVAGPDDMLDESNVLGQLRDSVDGLDTHDIADLPPFGSPYLTLSFQHPTEGSDFNSDYRAVGAGEHRWTFEIRSDTPRDVTLSWDDPYGKLAGTILVDLESNTEISPTPGGEYPVTMTGTVHRFEWRVSVEAVDPDVIFRDAFD